MNKAPTTPVEQDACGCTSRTLRSATVAEAGLASKQLARIVRIRYALELLTGAGVPLSAAAASSAFSDQAHMSRAGHSVQLGGARKGPLATSGEGLGLSGRRCPREAASLP